MKQVKHIEAQKIFGMNLREVRKSRGLTQEALAFKADIEPSTLNRIELGKAGTSLSNIFSLCKALGIEPVKLFESITLK